MSAITEIPNNRNFLSPIGFRFAIKKTPNVNYFVQAASVPSLTLGVANVPTPFVKLPLPGDHLQFGTFSITFRVDEEMRNYMELFNWMTALGKPQSFDQYRTLANQAVPGTGEGIYSDAILTVLSSAKNPQIVVNYRNIFPTDLSQLTFSATEDSINYVECTATFAYEMFTFDYLI
jgi:hypothetical protein